MNHPIDSAKPCPFCGSKAEDLAVMFLVDETVCFVRCEHCGAAGPDVDCGEKDPGDPDMLSELESKAFEQWNSRVNPISEEERKRALDIAHRHDMPVEDAVSDADVMWFRDIIYRLLGEKAPDLQ